MPRAFITGVSGQDGSYLAERLLEDGWDLHALVRSASAEDENPLDPAITVHEGDLDSPGPLTGLIDGVEPDVVFNLAGISSVAKSWDEPALTGRVTGQSVAVMLDAAWRTQERLGRPVRFVQASSAEIFGASDDVPQTERTAIRPTSPYGAAKAFAHHLVGVYRGRGLPASAAVLYNHESPRRPLAFVTRKITAGVAAIAAGRSDSLSLGNLDAQRDWGWAPDYVDALVRMAASDRPEDYIVATGVAHTVREFVGAAFAAAGIDDWEHLVTIDPRFARPVDAPLSVGDPSRIRDDLGWTPTLDFEGIVARMVENDRRLLEG